MIKSVRFGSCYYVVTIRLADGDASQELPVKWRM